MYLDFISKLTLPENIDLSISYLGSAKYVYSLTGEKLRVVHIVVMPGIPITSGELTNSEILSKDSINYLCGGTLIQ